MDEATKTPHVVSACPAGELDRTATERLVEDIGSQLDATTELIVVSLERTTTVRWNALCILGHAAQTWRAAACNVVVKQARPSLRAMLCAANVEKHP